jgi:hypothetical protein
MVMMENITAEEALIRQAFPQKLKRLYELVCEEYAQRLCVQWDFDRDHCFWFADRIGDSFCLPDEYTLSMGEVIYLVDNATPFSDFIAWWEYTSRQRDLMEEDKPYEFINLETWIGGYHGA